MTPDPTLIEQAARRLLEWCDGEHPSASTPGEDIRVVASAYLATLQGSAALPNEAMIADALETARQRAVVLFNAYALGVSMEHKRGEEQFIHDVKTFNDELTDALRFPISMRATTPTAPIQDTGASVPDQALAVPVEPVARLDPSGFDPSRVANIANRLSGMERRAMLHREGGSEACMSWGTAASLYEKGLTERNARFLRLTELGQRVRAALQIEAS